MTVFAWLAINFGASQSWAEIERIPCERLLKLKAANHPFFPESVSLFGHQVDYWRIPGEALNQFELIHSRQLKTGPAVYVGFYPNGHTYLVFGKTRVDANYNYFAPHVSRNAFLSPGLVFRIDDRGSRLTRQLEAIDYSSPYVSGASCVSSVCKMLFQADLSSGGMSLPDVFPDNLFFRLLQRGVQHSEFGNLPVDLFVVGDQAIKSQIFSMSMGPQGMTSLRGWINLMLTWENR